MHIAFEGPIGAGKTTLTRHMAEHLRQHQSAPVRLSLEDYEHNPFLADFYADPVRWALPAQLDFLVFRHRQLEALPAAPDALTVADHTLLKDRIFAELVLEGRELDLYRRIAEAMPAGGVRPDVLVYLEAEPATLLARIAKRGRDFESAITIDYLNDLCRLYHHHLETLDVPVIVVEATHLDPASPTQLASLWQRIRQAHPGHRDQSLY